MDVEALKKQIRSGQPTQYDEDKHIDLLAKIMDSTEGIAAFCDESMISKKTFYNWLETYPSFREAYDILRNRSQRIMEAHLLKNNSIHPPTWMIIYRNRHNNNLDKRITKMTNASVLDRLKGAREAFADGEINIAEYAQLVSALSMDAKTGTIGVALDKLLGDDAKNIKDMNMEELNEHVNGLIKLFQS